LPFFFFFTVVDPLLFIIDLYPFWFSCSLICPTAITKYDNGVSKFGR